jgi:hypothetical protein
MRGSSKAPQPTMKRFDLRLIVVTVAILPAMAGPGHARRRGHGGGHGGSDSDPLLLLEPYLPYILYGAIGLGVILIFWGAWKRFRRPAAEAKARIENAKRRSERRAREERAVGKVRT